MRLLHPKICPIPLLTLTGLCFAFIMHPAVSFHLHKFGIAGPLCFRCLPVSLFRCFDKTWPISLLRIHLVCSILCVASCRLGFVRCYLFNCLFVGI